MSTCHATYVYQVCPSFALVKSVLTLIKFNALCVAHIQHCKQFVMVSFLLKCIFLLIELLIIGQIQLNAIVKPSSASALHCSNNIPLYSFFVCLFVLG